MCAIYDQCVKLRTRYRKCCINLGKNKNIIIVILITVIVIVNNILWFNSIHDAHINNLCNSKLIVS